LTRSAFPGALSWRWGVGHILTAILNGVCRFIPFAACFSRAFSHASTDLFVSFAPIVGHNPQPVPLVISADGTCGNAVPLDTIPARGQVSENSANVGVSKQTWDVLQEHVAGSYFANDPPNVGPEVTRVFFSELFSGDAERLTWETRSDDIHDTTVSPAGECSQIMEDRGVVKASVSYSLSENFTAIPIYLHISNGTESPNKPLKGKRESADSGT
jgi:hypothetical protein